MCLSKRKSFQVMAFYFHVYWDSGSHRELYFNQTMESRKKNWKWFNTNLDDLTIEARFRFSSFKFPSGKHNFECNCTKKVEKYEHRDSNIFKYMLCSYLKFGFTNRDVIPRRIFYMNLEFLNSRLQYRNGRPYPDSYSTMRIRIRVPMSVLCGKVIRIYCVSTFSAGVQYWV